MKLISLLRGKSAATKFIWVMSLIFLSKNIFITRFRVINFLCYLVDSFFYFGICPILFFLSFLRGGCEYVIVAVLIFFGVKVFLIFISKIEMD